MIYLLPSESYNSIFLVCDFGDWCVKTNQAHGHSYKKKNSHCNVIWTAPWLSGNESEKVWGDCSPGTSAMAQKRYAVIQYV